MTSFSEIKIVYYNSTMTQKDKEAINTLNLDF